MSCTPRARPRALAAPTSCRSEPPQHSPTPIRHATLRLLIGRDTRDRTLLSRSPGLNARVYAEIDATAACRFGWRPRSAPRTRGPASVSDTFRITRATVPRSPCPCRIPLASCFVPSVEAKKQEARELLAHGRKDVCTRMRSNDMRPEDEDGSPTSNLPTSEPPVFAGMAQGGKPPALTELPATREYKEPEEVRQRLAEMGLDVAVFHEAITLSLVGYASATPLDPTNAAGTLAHIYLVRGVRSILLARGWTKSNHRNCSLTVSPDGRMAIRVSTGDEATGSDGVPTTKYPKGPAMKDMVAANKNLLLFSPEVLGLPPTTDSDVDEAEPRETWLLLTYPHEQGVAAELSLPIAMTGSRPTGWAERIRLPVVPTGPNGGGVVEPLSQGPTGPGAAMVDIDVPVVRKTG